MNNLSIIMYHRVIDKSNTSFPGIKGLDINAFKRQLDYLESNYSIIDINEVINYIKYSKELPKKSCILTFDDGYKDHTEYVFKELLDRNLKACFFPPVQPIVDRVLLDVDKIKLILACSKSIEKLLFEIKQIYLNLGGENHKWSKLWKTYGKPNRFDSKEIIFIKRLLQHALPKSIRNNICEILFKKYVSSDESSIAENLYMSIQNIKDLVTEGMYIGSHCYSHPWLSKETKESQIDEINLSLKFLEMVGSNIKDWVICYPYGDYNSETLEILKDRGAIAGLTTKVGLANLDNKDYLTLPRFDTNDFPQ